MKFGTNLRYLRKKHNLSQEQIADKLGYKNYTTVQKWESGLSEPNVGILKQISDMFKISMDSLLNDDLENERMRGTHLQAIQIPLYSSVSCGLGSFVDDEILEMISVPSTMLRPGRDYFAQYAKGDSMIGENIFDGDLLIFEKAQNLDNGQIGCFCLDEYAATCKKFSRDNNTGMIILNSANKDYDPIIITEEHEMFTIIGKLVLTINKKD